MIVDKLYDFIYQGKQGRNKGLSTGMPKLDSVTYGIQKGWFTVIGGDSGSGKSYYTLYTSVYKSFCQYLMYKNTSTPLKVDYLIFSFEMSSEVLLARLLSMYIYDTFHKVLSYSDILSFNQAITDSDYTIVQKSKCWLSEFEKHCTIIDKPVCADGLYAICKEWSKNYGTYIPIDSHREDYSPHDINQNLIVLVDHIKLLSTSNGSTVKQEIDKACDYLIYFRNKCKFTIYVVQQLNRNFKSMARRTESGGLYQSIQMDDFSDSSGPIQAAETVIALFYPAREKLMKCNGYNIKALKDRARIITVLKNRCGVADKSVGSVFYGEVGIFVELPKADEIEDYEQYVNLN